LDFEGIDKEVKKEDAKEWEREKEMGSINERRQNKCR
jgi:hypothetical protein